MLIRLTSPRFLLNAIAALGLVWLGHRYGHAAWEHFKVYFILDLVAFTFALIPVSAIVTCSLQWFIETMSSLRVPLIKRFSGGAAARKAYQDDCELISGLLEIW